jgi:hypothetical protein
MRKTFCTLIAVLFTLSMIRPNEARAEVPAKAKAFLTIVGYGTAAGALLGAASTAFGTSSRAIAQGASLGLYAGILFGTYVLVSHHNKRYGSYNDNSSPYQESSDIYSDEYQDGDGGGAGDDNVKSRGGFFDRFEVLQEKFHGQAFTLGQKEKGSRMPPLSLNIVQYNF